MIREGKYGLMVSGDGEIYSSTIRTGDENSSTYIGLVPPNGLMAYYSGQKILEMVANTLQGWLKFYYNGAEMGELIARSDGTGMDIDTSFWGKKLHIQGTPIEMYSGVGEFTLSTGSYFNMLGRFWNSFLPQFNNSGYIGDSTYKWNTVRATFITPGDLCFEETSCPICGQDFTDGDVLVLFVKTIHEEHHTMTIPMHEQCKGIQKVIDVEVPETEEKYRLKEDGQLEAYRVSKFTEAEEKVSRVKEGYSLDEKTGQFKKNALVVHLAKEGYTAKNTEHGAKFFDEETGDEVNLRNILEPIEIFGERPAVKDEALVLVTEMRRRPVTKTITVEVGKSNEATAGV